MAKRWLVGVALVCLPLRAMADDAAAAATGDTQPMSLLDCVQEALVHNPDIGASEQALRKALGNRQQADGAGLPGLDFGYTEILQRENKRVFGAGPPIVTTPGNLRSFQLKSDWVLYSGGALTANRQIARAAQAAAGHQLDAAVNGVVGDTVRAYLQLLRGQELKGVADQAVTQATEQVKVATDSFNVGAVPKVNMLRAEAARQNTLQQQLQADHGIALAGASLNAVMGRSQLTPVKVTPLARHLAEAPELLDSLKLAVAQRPELKANQKAIEINRQAVLAARAGYLPTATLSGTGTHTVGAGQFQLKDNWQVVFALQLNLWDWGVTGGKVRSADADYQAERRRFERLMHNIELQVWQSVLSIGEARKRVDAAQAEVEAARQALAIEELRYKSGEGIYLELLDARTAATQAEADLVGAYYDNALAEAEWLAATGGWLAESGEVRLPTDQALPRPAHSESQGLDYPTLRHQYGLDAPATPANPGK
ncbi:MAG: TolC family protein [Armatimonadetes bacterium]|nr:TolC family protein [Armatimonadota bacterium]